jgi:hypothetical protein
MSEPHFTLTADPLVKLCECGCGKPTLLARQDDTKRGLKKGQPQRFIRGHGHRGKPQSEEANRSRSATRITPTCGHPERKHCAKGLCNSCYTMQYKSKTPVTCGHPERSHRAKGMCEPCYMVWYFKERAKRGKLAEPPAPITACPHTDRKHFAHGMCRSCYTAYWRKENPEEAHAQATTSRFKRYGFTKERYAEIWERQGGKCANPGCTARFPLDVMNGNSGSVLHVDHSHSSGRVRGLLCRECNLALGYVNDSIDLLRGLIEYLESFPE